MTFATTCRAPENILESAGVNAADGGSTRRSRCPKRRERTGKLDPTARTSTNTDMD